MADLTSVGVTSGIPSSGTGTVATINYLTQVGAPISNGSTSAPVTVAITGSASAVTSTMSALVVSLSPNSSVRTTTLSSNPTVILSSNPTVIMSSATAISSGTVTLSSNPTVILSSNPTITSISSGAVSIINGGNTAAVKAAATAPTSNDPALVVVLSPNGINANGQATMANSAPVVIASNQTAVPTTVSSGTFTLSSNPTVILSSVASVVGSVTIGATTSGGLSRYSVIASTTTNATLVSSAACQLYKVECFNNTTTVAFLHLYDMSSTPTAGSSLVIDRKMVPANGGFISTTDIGQPYTTGLSFTFTGGAADADTTSITSSNGYIINLYYK